MNRARLSRFDAETARLPALTATRGEYLISDGVLLRVRFDFNLGPLVLVVDAVLSGV